MNGLAFFQAVVSGWRNGLGRGASGLQCLLFGFCLCLTLEVALPQEERKGGTYELY